MRLKIKQTIIAGSVILGTTIALAIGLSFLPTSDKKVKKINPNVKVDDDSVVDPNIPGTVDNDSDNPTVEPPLVLSDRKEASNAIKQEAKVNYLALGDSISAGFDSQLPQDYPGELKDNVLSGLSFPTYIASFIQASAKDKLASYNNLAKSNSTFKHWNALLTYDKKTIDSKTKEELQRVFETKDLVKKQKELKDLIFQSNLITVTLGANDFMDALLDGVFKVKILDLIETIKSKKLNYSQLVILANNTLKDVFDKLESSETLFINEIKKINPKVNLNIIGYPMPLTFLSSLIDSKLQLKDSDDVSFSVSKLVLDLLNNKLKYTANENNTYFINPFQQSFWNKNLKTVAPMLFDIHPGAFGYKKMAMDLFIKLMLPSRNITELNKNKISWDNAFLQSDTDSFLYQLEYEKPFDVVKKVLSDNPDEFFKTKDKLYLEHEKEFNIQNYNNRVLNADIFKNVLFDKLFSSLFESDFYKEIDPDKSLYNFLHDNNDKNIKEIKRWYQDGKFIANFLFDVQKQFYDTDWDKDGYPGAVKYKFDYLLTSFKEQAIKEDRIINIITSLCKLDCVKNQKADLKNIITMLVQNFIKHNFTVESINKIIEPIYNDKIAKYISKNDLVNLIKIVVNSEEIKTIIGDLFINFVNESDKYANAKTFKDLWNIFINNDKNQKAIRDFFKLISNSLIKDNEFKQIVSRVVSNLKNVYPEIFKNVNQNEVVKLVYQLLTMVPEIDQNYNIVGILANKLIDEWKLHGIKKADYKEVFKNVGKEFKDKFDKDHYQENVLKLLKILAKNDPTSSVKLSDFKDTIVQLLVNGINYVGDKKDLIKNMLDNLYQKHADKLKDWISKEDLTSLISKTLKTQEFQDLLGKLLDKVISTNNQDILNSKTLFEALRFMFVDFVNSNAYDAVSPLIKKVLSFTEAKELFKKALAKIPAEAAKSISDQQVVDIIDYLLNQDSFRKLVENFLTNGIFNQNLKLDDLKDIWNILKVWTVDSNRAFIKENASKLISSLIKQPDLRNILASYLYNILAKYPTLVKDISESEMQSFISSVVLTYPKINEILNLDNLLLDTVFPLLDKKRTKEEFKEALKTWANKLKDKISSGDWETTIVKLIKAVITKDTISDHKELLTKLANNALVYISEDLSLGGKLFDKLPKKVHEKIDAHITKDEFNKMFISFFKDSKTTKNIINILLDALYENVNEYQKANTLIDILKVFVSPEERKNKLSQSIQDWLKEILKNKELQKLLKGLFRDNVKPYGINPDEPAQENMINDLLANISEYATELKLIPNIADGLVNNFAKYHSLKEFKDNIKDVIVDSLKLKEYSFVKTFLVSTPVKKHKDTIREDINKVVEGITSKDNLVEKFINDLKLVEAMRSTGLSDAEITEFLKQVIKSPNAKEVLDSFLHELLDNADEYGKLDSWGDALEKFFSSTNANSVRAGLKKWVVELFNKQPVAYALGKIMANGLKAKEYQILDNQIIIVQKFINSFGKVLLSHDNIINDMVDNIFEELKHIKKHIGKNTFADAFKDAAIKGATKFIRNNSGKVSMSKIFDQTNLLADIFAKTDRSSFVDMINLLFSSSMQNKDKCIYALMFNPTNSNNDFEMGLSGIVDVLKGKIGHLISAIVSPLMDNYLSQLETQNVYGNINDLKQNNSAYQAIWRIYAFLLAMTKPQAGIAFWNNTGLTAERYINDGFVEAMNKAIANHASLRTKYAGNMHVIGFENNGGALDYYFLGVQNVSGVAGSRTKKELFHLSDGASVPKGKYGRDYLLAYIEWQDDKDNKYNNGKLCRDVLINDLHNGFMPTK